MTRGAGVLEEVLRMLPKGMAIDVAAGSGNFSSTISQCSRNCDTIIATDAFLKPLKTIMPQFNDPKIIPAAMDGCRLAFPDNTFNSAVISNSLHHMPKPELVLREMKRVLEPGGMFVINEMFSDEDQTSSQDTHTLMHNWWGAVDSLNGLVHNRVYKRNELENLAEFAGFEGMQYRTFEDLSCDPFDKQVTEHLRKVWEIYIKKAEGNSDLENRGREALSHLDKYGFSGARALLAYGFKPV